jgi:hypothetical protein
MTHNTDSVDSTDVYSSSLILYSDVVLYLIQQKGKYFIAPCSVVSSVTTDLYP